MNDSIHSGIFHLEKITNDISLCFLCIPDFIDYFFPQIDRETYRTRPNMWISREECDIDFLNNGELERCNGFKSLKKQVEWMSGRMAVKKVITSLPGISSHAGDITISYMKSGAPYVEGFEDINISVSHSNDLACVALSEKSDSNVGVDIEMITPADLTDVMAVAFSDRERAHLVDSSNEDIFQSFTVKEAYLKYIRRGFSRNPAQVEYFGSLIYYNNEPVENIAIINRKVFHDYSMTLIYGRGK